VGAKKLYANICITFVNEKTEAAIMIKIHSVTDKLAVPKRALSKEESCCRKKLYIHTQ
jgi:hypothetical protein